MDVKMKIGKNAGTIVDLPFAVARDLIAQDQAEEIPNPELPKPVATRIDTATVEGSAPAGEVVTVTPAEPRTVAIGGKKFKTFRR